MNVIFLPEVFDYFEEIACLLHEKGYFEIYETSRKQVEDLFENIKTNLPKKHHKPMSPHLARYGKNMEYASFRKSKQTSWYVFFRVYQENEQIIYQIRYIANNRVIAKHS